MNRKLLFLDFDGVLNGANCAENKHPHWEELQKSPKHWGLCQDRITILADIVERVPGLEVVISSSWRIGTTLEALRDLLAPFGIPRGQVIDKTPRLHSAERIDHSVPRGMEIATWMAWHVPAGAKFAILDDDGDMVHLMPNLVRTDFRKGLTSEDADKVIALLN